MDARERPGGREVGDGGGPPAVTLLVPTPPPSLLPSVWPPRLPQGLRVGSEASDRARSPEPTLAQRPSPSWEPSLSLDLSEPPRPRRSEGVRHSHVRPARPGTLLVLALQAPWVGKPALVSRRRWRERPQLRGDSRCRGHPGLCQRARADGFTPESLRGPSTW